MNNAKKFKILKSEKGVSLIITLFIMIIVLAVVLSISAILYSEVKIIRNVSNSMASLYAAESGIEKVLYYDRQVIPAGTGATRGLCSMFTANSTNNYCSTDPSSTSSGVEHSIYCNNPETTALAAGGCDPDNCDNCGISFNTTMDNNRTYSVTASVSPSYYLDITSSGAFGGAERKIDSLVPTAQYQGGTSAVFTPSTNSTTANTDPVLGLVGISVSSDNPAVATADLTTVSGYVTVTSVSPGTALIRVADASSHTATLGVTVADDGSITIGIVPYSPWLVGWAHRKQITISNANVVGEDLTNFPLLVKIMADSDMSTALSTGYDVRFTNSDETTLLSYERESWSGGGGSAVTANLWVKVPTVTTATPTNIYIYYGKSGASDGQSATDVWSNGYLGVWHLINPTNPTDSTGLNSGANHGATATTGYINGAGSFNGGSYIDTGSKITVTNYTIDAWINTLTLSGEGRILSNGGYGNYNGAVDFMRSGSDITILNQNSGSQDVYRSASILSANVWTHVAVTYNSSTLQPIIYINGAPSYSSGTTIRVPSQTPSYDMNIGTNGNPTSYFNGALDEVRISNIARDANWIKFEYYNQSSATNELSWGNQE